MLVAVTMLSVSVLQFQIIRCPSVGCARHKIMLTPFVLITESRVDGCPRPWTTLPTPMDNRQLGKYEGEEGWRDCLCALHGWTQEACGNGGVVACDEYRSHRHFVGVWGERCRAIDGFIVYKWHILRFSCMHLSDRSHKGCLWERCNHL